MNESMMNKRKGKWNICGNNFCCFFVIITVSKFSSCFGNGGAHVMYENLNEWYSHIPEKFFQCWIIALAIRKDNRKNPNEFIHSVWLVIYIFVLVRYLWKLSHWKYYPIKLTKHIKERRKLKQVKSKVGRARLLVWLLLIILFKQQEKKERTFMPL